MQVVFRNLLAVSFSVWVASCALNDQGLGGMDAHAPRPDGSAPSGSAGSSAAGTSGEAGTTPASSGEAGTTPTPTGGTAGSSDPTGGAGDGAAGTPNGMGGAGGEPSSGGAGTTGSAGTIGSTGGAGTIGTSGGAGTAAAGTGGGAAGTGAAGTGAAGTGAAGTAGSTLGPAGCSDGTREGYLDKLKYPKIAACAGGWEDPGLTSSDSRTPQCERRAGNDGDRTDGRGCSVADLCASGWHVCESAKVVAMHAASCADAIAPFGDNPVFFVTRQRGTGLLCDDNQGGANNLYGCGTIGNTADKSCSPFTRMLRDSDCQSNFPWSCAQGPIGTSQEELQVVTKRGSTRGGVLCCKDF